MTKRLTHHVVNAASVRLFKRLDEFIARDDRGTLIYGRLDI